MLWGMRSPKTHWTSLFYSRSGQRALWAPQTLSWRMSQARMWAQRRTRTWLRWVHLKQTAASSQVKLFISLWHSIEKWSCSVEALFKRSPFCYLDFYPIYLLSLLKWVHHLMKWAVYCLKMIMGNESKCYETVSLVYFMLEGSCLLSDMWRL